VSWTGRFWEEGEKSPNRPGKSVGQKDFPPSKGAKGRHRGRKVSRFFRRQASELQGEPKSAGENRLLKARLADSIQTARTHTFSTRSSKITFKRVAAQDTPTRRLTTDVEKGRTQSAHGMEKKEVDAEGLEKKKTNPGRETGSKPSKARLRLKDKKDPPEGFPKAGHTTTMPFRAEKKGEEKGVRKGRVQELLEQGRRKARGRRRLKRKDFDLRRAGGGDLGART